METITETIEAVADKRHARLCAFYSERKSAKIVCEHLNHLKLAWKDNKYISNFIEELLKGYSVKL